MAPPAASAIWNGTGTNAMNSPMAIALVIEERFRIHRFGLFNQPPNSLLSVRSPRTDAALGRYRRRKRLGISVLEAVNSVIALGVTSHRLIRPHWRPKVQPTAKRLGVFGLVANSVPHLVQSSTYKKG